jgi:hypothetical protein
MSLRNQTLHNRARETLQNLLDDLQPVIDQHVDKLDHATLNFILTNYGSSLKLDLKRDFERARHTSLTSSPFDSILEDFNDNNQDN